MPRDVTVVIPTRGRPEKLRACLEGLATQTLDADRFEILVGIDGPDAGEADVAAQFSGSMSIQTLPGTQAGPAAARNRAMRASQGRITLLLNDDVVPDRHLLEHHQTAQMTLESRGRTAMVLGSAPWMIHEPDRLFDRLIRETSMVFFYDQMTGPAAADPEHDWGFRHTWTLNLSVPTAALEDVGGFCESLPSAAFEDLELGWRLRERFDAPVLYRPEAIVEHDHRYEPEAFLVREFKLGRDAYALAGANPRCAMDTFGRDLQDLSELEYSRAFVEREERTAAVMRESFEELAQIPASELSGPNSGSLVRMLYQQHLLLKRWMWRAGLVAAAEGAELNDVGWPV